jgi:translation initiation factor 4G
VFGKFRSILNKLTPDNFDRLVHQVKELRIESEEQLLRIISILFEKAVDEPNYAEAYSKLCREVGMLYVSPDDKKINFKNRLLSVCQKEFEKHSTERVKQIRECKIRLEEVDKQESTVSEKEREEERAAIEEQIYKIRRRALGIVVFVGELYKHTMLTSNIMNSCMNSLMALELQLDEETIECVCKLLTTIGAKLDKEEKKEVNGFFSKLSNILKKKDKLCSRIRFMIQDLVDLRQNNWVPRRKDINLKTMTQIAKEAENEQLQSNMLNYQPRGRDNGNDMRNSRNSQHLKSGT